MPPQIFHQLVNCLTRHGMNEGDAKEAAIKLENLGEAEDGAVVDVLEGFGMDAAVAEIAAPEIVIILDVAA